MLSAGLAQEFRESRSAAGGTVPPRSEALERREVDVYALEYPDVCARLKAAFERWERFDNAEREPKETQRGRQKSSR
jgi:hypothetical protein